MDKKSKSFVNLKYKLAIVGCGIRETIHSEVVTVTEVVLLLTIIKKIIVPLVPCLLAAVYTVLSSLSKRNWTTSSKPIRQENSLLHDGMMLKSSVGSCCQTRKRQT